METAAFGRLEVYPHFEAKPPCRREFKSTNAERMKSNAIGGKKRPGTELGGFGASVL